MGRSKYASWLIAGTLCAAACCSSLGQDTAAPKPAETKGSAPAVTPEGMAAMMELMKPGENHKLLARGAGTWSYAVKMWMNPDPNAGPSESTGTAVIREVMGGRYMLGEHTGRFDMPGPDGKLASMEFKGMSTDGYDNVKKRFVSSWIDNMGTGIMYLEGTYDPVAKVLTYRGEYEPMPGMKTKVREAIQLTDNDHRTLEFYEDRGGHEVKTMEITYTRKS